MTEEKSTQSFEFSDAREKLQDLLQQTQNEDVSAIQSYISSLTGGDVEKKLALDQAFRDHLQTLIMAEAPHSDLTSVVTLSITAAQNNLCSPSLPFLLLTDTFDSVTIDVCNKVFKFVEEKVSVWNSPQFYVSGKNFLLRMSNDLLRRLSKSHDTVFCGRIQLFLAKFFPLDEKSGLNLMSNFNKENLTVYNKENLEGPIQMEEKDDSMEYEEGEMREGSSSSYVDYQLYRKFWSLQDYFRDPLQCYNKEKWKQFMKNSNSVMAAFKSMKLEPDSTSSKGKDSSKTGDESSVFFAKYLTSEKLFDLQLSDSSFRRFVLVQFLILFQYLGQQVKFKAATLVLTEEMQLYMKATTEKIYELLKEIPPDGEKFAADIKHVLDREEHWNNWKNEGCPSFVKEKPKEDQEPKRRPRKRTLGEELELNAGSSKKIDMGSPELTRLWNQCPDNLEACRSEKRMFLPALEEFFEEAIEQADPDAMIEDEYKIVNNSNYAWQALRLLARRSPHFFQTAAIAAQPSIKTIPAYLELMATKLAKEMPQFNHVEEIKTEAMDNDELLKAGEEEKEDKKVSAEDLELVAMKLGINWKTLAVELGFTEEEISTIQTDLAEVKEQSRHVLKSWEIKHGDEASKEVLLKALTESGLNDIVESVFQKKKQEEKNEGEK